MQSSKLETGSIPPVPLSKSRGITKNPPFPKRGTPASYRSGEAGGPARSLVAGFLLHVQQQATRKEKGGDAKTDVSSCRGEAPEGYFET
ncbi:MAG: hypothetical protein JRD93_11635 [Deltaproteobacteria bacterium]|nr:hypothetical protein [Deltaproteobacteria bacterium]